MQDPLIGQRVFGGYDITKKLGEGGMGAVYLAEDTQLGKKIAVKVLLPALSEHLEIVERFKNEAVAASALNHPHIIDIVARGEFDGRHWIAMQFLPGSDLGDYLVQVQQMEPAAALQILVQVCSALEVAHEKRIVHRDLKPDNIFITQPPVGWQWGHETPFVKLLDFGIAKLGDPNLAGQVKTRTHQVMGTPLYMSPEQARGLPTVNHLTDIYSLGVIVYQMLTGALPYTGHSLADIVVKQTMGEARPPIEIVPGLPPGWNEAILSAIAVEPAHRPQSAHAFCQQLWANNAELQGVAHSIDAAFVNKESAPAAVRPVSANASTALLEPNVHRPTTLGAAAGVTHQPAVIESQSSWHKWALAGLLVVGLGVGGVLLATGSGSGKNESAANQPAPTDEPTPADDSTTTKEPTLAKPTPPVVAKAPVTKPPVTKPPVAPVAKTKVVKLSQVTITTVPTGATVRINGKRGQRGPVTKKFKPGTKLIVKVSKRRYRSAKRTFVVAATLNQEFDVLLSRRRRSGSTRTTGTKTRPTGTKATGTNATGTKATGTKTTEPTKFDPDGVEGS